MRQRSDNSRDSGSTDTQAHTHMHEHGETNARIRSGSGSDSGVGDTLLSQRRATAKSTAQQRRQQQQTRSSGQVQRNCPTNVYLKRSTGPASQRASEHCLCVCVYACVYLCGEESKSMRAATSLTLLELACICSCYCRCIRVCCRAVFVMPFAACCCCCCYSCCLFRLCHIVVVGSVHTHTQTSTLLHCTCMHAYIDECDSAIGSWLSLSRTTDASAQLSAKQCRPKRKTALFS